jgi:hypothetical protein
MLNPTIYFSRSRPSAPTAPLLGRLYQTYEPDFVSSMVALQALNQVPIHLSLHSSAYPDMQAAFVAFEAPFSAWAIFHRDGR